jgi:hypothetical protein
LKCIIEKGTVKSCESTRTFSKSAHAEAAAHSFAKVSLNTNDFFIFFFFMLLHAEAATHSFAKVSLNTNAPHAPPFVMMSRYLCPLM